jgi:hypothetical protein
MKTKQNKTTKGIDISKTREYKDIKKTLNELRNIWHTW